VTTITDPVNHEDVATLMLQMQLAKQKIDELEARLHALHAEFEEKASRKWPYIFKEDK
jgi:hypothetical protein